VQVVARLDSSLGPCRRLQLVVPQDLNDSLRGVTKRRGCLLDRRTTLTAFARYWRPSHPITMQLSRTRMMLAINYSISFG